MKFSNYLVQIKGVSIYPLISLLLFVIFILGVFYYVYNMKKSEVDYDKNLPFNEK